MLNSDVAVPEEHHFLLSSLSPGSAQKRIALVIVLGLLVALYLITGPLSGIQLGAVNAFVAVYGTAMFVTDSITAFLLYAQFYIIRSRGILVIASGYLFTALVVVLYVFAFPGVLAPDGVIGGVQTSAWLYLTWHTVFPTFVIGYALSKDENLNRRLRPGKVRAALFWSIACTAALAGAVGYVATIGEPELPHLMLDRMRFHPGWPYRVGAPIASVCIAAIVVLWIRRRSVLDLWLMVVMFLYLVEVPLSWYPQPARFSTGWYAVRVVGFVSSSLVLIVLLYEITTLYARLLGAVLGQRREREARLMTGNAVAASIAHEMRQPLAAMVTTAEAGFRFLDRATPNMNRAKEALQQIAADGLRAGTLVETIRSSFKSDVKDRTSIDLNDLIQEALALGDGQLQKHRILVQATPNLQVPGVVGNRVQLQQVLLNLIVNAIDAMAAKDDQRILTVKSESYEGDRVMVSVADTGVGIAALDVDRIFNPLFTTKSDGMGMGLSICRAIIEAHEGRLWFTANAPRGAVFCFTLQAVSAASAVG
ncbi:MASE4 domain-containing protein [Variovorax paradoxus]|nr:MASE4 domain-containing protein [Variovorax paradoxus]MBT2304183.1 MASE4 domain-containing protein [Variovorax paradoxus]